MKKLVLFLFLGIAVLLGGATREERLEAAGKVYGKIHIVTHGADYRVRVVTHAEDLRVRVVTHGANNPGQWQFVTHGEDFSIQFVTHGEDFSIQFVTHGEGI